MSGKDRFNAGYKYAVENIREIVAEMKNGEAFNIVTIKLMGYN